MWIIEDVFGDESQKLIASLETAGIRHVVAEHGPTFQFNDLVGLKVVRGSIDFVENNQQYPRNLLTIENYDCSTYYQHVPNLLNRNFILIPWWRLTQFGADYFSIFGKNRLFIRPNSGRKIFTGNYITRKWWKKDLETIANLPGNDIQDSDLVLVAKAQMIAEEYRVCMHEDKMITYSKYKSIKQLDVHEDVIREFAEKTMGQAKYYPDKYYTLDICSMPNHSLRVVELNSLFSAGLYDCDYDKLVQYIEKEGL